ncbi:MAG: hypothetical protein R3B41_00135 [Candidatus Doudnabacteria bacterium]
MSARICDRQKLHELGFGYAAVLGAGGVVCDFDGNPLDDVVFDFNAQQDVILAANKKIADGILDKIAQFRDQE